MHGFGPLDGITFDKTTFKGQQVPPIEFTMLKNSLKSIADVAKGKSLSSKKWFGHDYE